MELGLAISLGVQQTPRARGAFDGLPLYAAFGLRRLRAAWTGPLVTVRRDSDQAAATIGVDGAGRLDVAGLTAFTGGASAFVTQWWDQTGSGCHAIQTTASAQPRLVNAGVVETMSGVAGTAPGLVFDGSDDVLSVANSIGFGRAADCVVMAGTARRDAATPSRQFLATAYSSAGGSITLLSSRVADGGSSQIFCRRGGSSTATTFSQTPALAVGAVGRCVFRGVYSSGALDITVNGLTTTGAMVDPGQTEDLNGAKTVEIGSSLPGRIGTLVLSRDAVSIALVDGALAETLT